MEGRNKSPPRRKYERDEAGVEMDRRMERTGRVSHDAVTGDGGNTVRHYSNPKSGMEEGASIGQVQVSMAVSMQTVAEASNENPREVDKVEAEISGSVTDSMQTNAVLGANRADVEEHISGAVTSKPDFQLLLNGMPNLNTWTEKEAKSANRNEVQEVSRSEEILEHVPLNKQLVMDEVGLSNYKPKPTWIRFNRMEFGLGGLARAITLPTLGKRDTRDEVSEQVDENEHKRRKVVNKGGSSKDLSAGVDNHPCRK